MEQIRYNKKHNSPRHPASKTGFANPLAIAHRVQKAEAATPSNLRKHVLINAAKKVVAEAKFVKACETGKAWNTARAQELRWRSGVKGVVVVGDKVILEGGRACVGKEGGEKLEPAQGWTMECRSRALAKCVIGQKLLWRSGVKGVVAVGNKVMLEAARACVGREGGGRLEPAQGWTMNCTLRTKASV